MSRCHDCGRKDCCGATLSTLIDEYEKALKESELAMESLATFAGVEPNRIDGTWGHLADKIREMRSIVEFRRAQQVEHIPHSDVWRMTAWDLIDSIIGKMADADQTYVNVSFHPVVGGSLAKLTARFDLTFAPEDEYEE